jgi:hypothetical protein
MILVDLENGGGEPAQVVNIYFYRKNDHFAIGKSASILGGVVSCFSDRGFASRCACRMEYIYGAGLTEHFLFVSYGSQRQPLPPHHFCNFWHLMVAHGSPSPHPIPPIIWHLAAATGSPS